MKSKSNKSSERRLTILTLSEQKSIYGFPRFDNQERKYYFAISKIEKDILDSQFRGFTSKLFFLLQLGYFKATFQFFHFKHQDLPEDTHYIVKKYFPHHSKERFKGIYTKKLRQSHVAQILKLLSYRLASKNDRKDMFEKAKSIVFIDANPKYIFKELLRFSRERKFVLPSYTSMQDIISKSISDQEKHIIQKLRSLLNKDIKSELDALLHKESENRYQLTLIKRPIQNFSNKQATDERRKRDDLDSLFEAAKQVFREIKMNHSSIKYFAQLVDRYTIQQLKQFNDIKRYFYILCFVYYKYLKINDDLVKTFLYFVSKYKGEVKLAVKDKISQMRLENNHNMALGAKIFRLITGKDINDHDAIKVFREKAYHILSKDKINKLALYMERSDLDYESFRWLEYDSKFNKIRRNLRHLFKSLALTTNNKKSIEPLFEAMTYLKDTFHKSRQKKTSNAPANFIPKNLKKHIYTKDKDKKTVLDKDRYETLVYSMLKNKIDSSDVFVHDSLEYRSLESDILDLNYFTENKSKICKTLGTEFLNTPLKVLLKRKMDIVNTYLKVHHDRHLKVHHL